MKKFLALLFALILVSATFFFVVGNNAFMMLVVFQNKDHQFEVILEETTSYTFAKSYDIEITLEFNNLTTQKIITNTTNLQLIDDLENNKIIFTATNYQKTKENFVVTDFTKKYYYNGATLYIKSENSKTKQVLPFKDALPEIVKDSDTHTNQSKIADIFKPIIVDETLNKDYKLQSNLYFSFKPFILGQKISYTLKDDKNFKVNYIFDTFRNLKVYEESSLDTNTNIQTTLIIKINSINKLTKLTTPSANELATYL